MKENYTSVKRLATVRQLADLYPAFSRSSIRYLIFNEKTNGFSNVIRRIGRKVLLDLDAFESWIAKQGDSDE